MISIPAEVQNLFKADSVLKNFHVHFPNGEYRDLLNADIVRESVRFTESLCSQQYLKFGLTEASQIEFECVGVPNIRGAVIQCAIEIDVSSLGDAWITANSTLTDVVLLGESGTALGTDAGSAIGGTVWETGDFLTPQVVLVSSDFIGYRVPLGEFVVDTCPRNHGAMAHRQVTAYSRSFDGNKYMSKWGKWYLKTYFTDEVLQISDGFVYQFWFQNAGTDMLDYVTSSSEFSLDDTYTSTDAYPSTQIVSNTGLTVTLKDANSDDVTLWFGGTKTADRPSSYQINGGLYYASQSNVEENIAAIALVVRQWLAAKAYDYTDSGTNIDKLSADVARHVCGIVLPGSYTGSYTNTGGTFALRKQFRNRQGIYNDYASTDQDNLIWLSKADDGTMSNLQMETTTGIYFYLANSLTELTVRITDATSTTTTETIVSSSMPISDENHLYEVAVTNPFLPEFTLQFDPAESSNVLTQMKLHSYKGQVDFGSIMNGILELCGKFGRTGRDGSISIFELDNTNEYSLTPTNYEECWWDEDDIEGIGEITYTYNDDEEGEQTSTYTVTGGGLSTYQMDDNYILKNGIGWSISTINSALATYFVPSANSFVFTAIDLTARGLPYLESGDPLQITAADNTVIHSYIMERTISGIQSLSDSITAQGGELIDDEED